MSTNTEEVNSYFDLLPRRYARSHYLALIYTPEYMSHYILTYLEPRHSLWWPTCLWNVLRPCGMRL